MENYKKETSLKNNVNGIKEKIIKIIGFGNAYMGDDGIGIRVIEQLKKQGTFDNLSNIEILDGGTSGVDLVFLLKDADFAIIVDAVDAGQPAGEIITFSPEDIKETYRQKKSFKSYSLHDIDLYEAFELIKTLKLKIKIVIIGIKPIKIGYSDKISDEVQAKIPEIIDRIQYEFQKI